MCRDEREQDAHSPPCARLQEPRALRPPTGMGKSKLLDAIVFLSALVNGTLLDAALPVRDPGGQEWQYPRTLSPRGGNLSSTKAVRNAENETAERAESRPNEPARASVNSVVCSLKPLSTRRTGPSATTIPPPTWEPLKPLNRPEYRVSTEAWCRSWEWATIKVVIGDGTVWIWNLPFRSSQPPERAGPPPSRTGRVPSGPRRGRAGQASGRALSSKPPRRA